MKPFIAFAVAAFLGSPAAADDAALILADQPFKSAPWANGDYFTVTLALDQCLLSKTVTEFDKHDVAEDSHRIDINLKEVDAARIELVSDAVTLWAREGASVICTDIAGEDCVVRERPGEHISVPASVGGAAYLQALSARVAACQ